MLEKILVKEQILEGQTLLDALQRRRFPMSAALWYYMPESMEWRLVIVSSTVDHRGPMAAYTRVQHVLASLSLSHLALRDIALLGPSSGDYQNLRATVPNWRPGNYNRFEDAYVYPLAHSA